MAKQLGVKQEEVREMETRMTGQDVTLEPYNDDGEEGFGPLAYLADPQDEPLQQMEQAQSERLSSEGLQHALSSLDERSRRIIEARWLREQDTATLHELAAELGVSAERVRQIEAKALQKMKAVIAA
jgi:RNA polymerase sigma-32 factor